MVDAFICLLYACVWLLGAQTPNDPIKFAAFLFASMSRSVKNAKSHNFLSFCSALIRWHRIKKLIRNSYARIKIKSRILWFHSCMKGAEIIVSFDVFLYCWLFIEWNCVSTVYTWKPTDSVSTLYFERHENIHLITLISANLHSTTMHNGQEKIIPN